MIKSKKFWNYESSQNFDLKQETFDNFKSKGRIFEDFNYFYEAIGIGTHPSLKQPYGKEHSEPTIISFTSTLVDINTIKILFTILPNSKIVTLKFCNNNFEISNLEQLINSLLVKPNNISSFILQWNSKIKIDGSNFNLNDNTGNDMKTNYNRDPNIPNQLLKCQQLVSNLATSQKLKILCLRGNLLGDETACLLFENLKTNQSLKVFNMYKNNLTSKCMNKFNQMIENNKCLEEINMGSNYLLDEDLESLKNFVGRIPLTLEGVENHNKQVKERDLIIEKNKKLKLQKKPEEPVPIIEEVILVGETYYTIKNSTLKSLNLIQNLFTENSFDALKFILDNNTDLFIAFEGKIFNKTYKDQLNDPNGKYSNNLFLTK